MQDHAAQAPAWTGYIPVLIVPVVLFFRYRRMIRLQPLRIERLWIVPVLYAMVVLGLYVSRPPHGAGWLACAAALVAGGALGWQRGRTVRLHLDPATHTVLQRGSFAGLIFIAVLIAVKSAARPIGARFGIDVALATDALATAALGMIAATRAEMFIRASRLLAGKA